MIKSSMEQMNWMNCYKENNIIIKHFKERGVFVTSKCFHQLKNYYPEIFILKKIGFIGYGSMGRVIINGFLFSKALKPDEVVISTRTESKLYDLKNNYPEIEISQDNCTTASKSNLLFLLVGTADVKDVLEEINEFTSEKTHIVYISAALTMDNVSGVFKGKITKVMPSLTSEVLEGVSLINHNPAVNNEEGEYINTLFSSIGDVKIIDESDFDVGADITSCSPAFIARICMEFARIASNNSGFSIDETEEMIIKTFYGTSKLLYEKNMSFENLISSVATKGGITEAGLKVLDDEIPGIFNKLFITTIKKHEIIKRELKEEY
jgi:pyrroline-5-carboxylate reductase